MNAVLWIHFDTICDYYTAHRLNVIKILLFFFHGNVWYTDGYTEPGLIHLWPSAMLLFGLACSSPAYAINHFGTWFKNFPSRALTS
jgi:hypothetical protein